MSRHSRITDTERAALAKIAYQLTAATTGSSIGKSWEVVGEPQNLDNGLEIYALHKKGTSEIVFAVRGSDSTPFWTKDWGVSGANGAFSGTMHPQFETAIEFVKEIRTSFGPDYTYSVTGHSKGGGIAQILAHTFRQ